MDTIMIMEGQEIIDRWYRMLYANYHGTSIEETITEEYEQLIQLLKEVRK